MTGAQDLRFAGPAAELGALVLGGVGLVMGLLAVGLLLVAALGLQAGVAPGGLAVGAMAALLLWQLRGDLRRFRTLRIEPDGAWVLLGSFQRELERLPADRPRAIAWQQRRVMRFVGTVRVDTEGWLEIETPDGRVRESAHASPEAQAPARASLDAHLRAAARPR